MYCYILQVFYSDYLLKTKMSKLFLEICPVYKGLVQLLNRKVKILQKVLKYEGLQIALWSDQSV